MSDDQQPTQDTSPETTDGESRHHSDKPPVHDSGEGANVTHTTETQAADSVVAPQPSVSGQPAAPSVAPQENPGQTLGIVSIVLGALAIWIVGLPLAIVSLVKSSKARASKTLGIVGLILNILSLLASIFFVVVVLASIPYLVERAKDVQTAQSSLTASYTIPLTTDYKPARADVSFTLPAAYYGWTLTSADKDGLSEFTKDDNTATFMTYYGTIAGLSGSDKETTQKAMADYIYQLEGVEVSNSESTVSFVCESDGKMLEFETKQITATSEGRSLRGIVAVRMYEGHELSVVYLADSDAFSLTEWEELIGQVTIKDGVAS